MSEKFSIEVYQQDFMPGWGSFVFDTGEMTPDSKPFMLLNIGGFMAAVEDGKLHPKDVPYIIAETMMHEIIHSLEHWAGVEFSEDRVEELLTQYRKKFGRDTIWEYIAEVKAKDVNSEPPVQSQQPTKQTQKSGTGTAKERK